MKNIITQLAQQIDVGNDSGSTTSVDVPIVNDAELLTNALNLVYFLAGVIAVIVIIVAGIMYTTSSGERRIRVHTAQLPVTAGLNALYEAADVDACTNLLGRVALDTAMNGKLLDGAEKLQTSCLEALRAYRSLCPPHAKNMSTLLLPESLKLMPLYTLGLMKSALFNAADVRPDERSAAFYAFSTMALPHSTAMLHPRLIQAHPPTQQVSPAVSELPRSLQTLSDTGRRS